MQRRYEPLVAGSQRIPLQNIQNTSNNNDLDKYKKNPVFVKSLPTSNGNVLEFQILGVLGQGGFAKCYQVKHMHSQRIFAAKCVKKAMLRDKPDLFPKLKSEIGVHKSLSHPGIVKYEGHFESQEAYFIVLEMCCHSSMKELLTRRKRLKEPEVQYYMLQILDAVAYMHSKLVIHRDLKLANIFLQNGLSIKIGDFGLAAQLSDKSERKLSFCGTPNYLAPELLDRTGYGHSFEADIWSIGIIMYTLLVGSPPFASNQVNSIFENIQRNNIKFPAELNISEIAKDVILKILRLNPNERLSIEAIRNHPFFTISSPPASLPDDALLQTPVFCRKNILNPNQQIQLRSIPENEILNVNVIENIENQPDEDVIMTSDSVYEKSSSPFVTKYFNYSNKYGLGYLMSSGYVGVYFNDETSMIAKSNSKIFYITKDKSVMEASYNFFRAHSKETDKKARLLEYFADKLQIQLSSSTSESQDSSEFVYLQSWAVSKYDISFKLSNGCVQSTFPDNTRLMVDRYGRGLYVDDKENDYRFDIQSLSPDLEPLQKRVEHLKRLVAYYNK